MALIEENISKQKKSVVSESHDTSDSDNFENVLRPKTFDEYIGQPQLKENLRVFVAAAKKRKEPLDHQLFYGPPGLGKTTLSMILASEMKSSLRLTSGPALEKPGDLAAIVSNLSENDFLFIDEIHRLRRPVEEILYSAMEDFSIDLIIGKGPSARTMRMEVPRFTLVGATTQISLLSSPLRDRFGHIEKLQYYDIEALEQILERSSKLLGIKLDQEALTILARSCRWTPRVANRLLRRIRDFAQMEDVAVVKKELVQESLKKLHVDTRGLDFSDQQYLRNLCEKFNGGPTGLSTLASAMSEDTSTLEEVIEPFLIREGFLERAPRGRTATEQAFSHLGIRTSDNKRGPSLFHGN